MITPEKAAALRDQLASVLSEDTRNVERLLSRLDSITRDSGISAHAALLLLLTHLAFEDDQARKHWDGILAQREQLSAALGRDPGLRVALLDYFMNVNRRLSHPILIDLDMLEAGERGGFEDSLTRMPTDRVFRTGASTELRRARRYGGRVPVALFDLDDFARINREFGEIVGDRILREAAALLRNEVRDTDLVARTGEDGFGLVLPETDRNGALVLAERFRWEMEAHFAARDVGGRAVALTVSAGVACYPDDAESPEALLECAAQALYCAKAEGKNTVRAYRPERRRYLRFDLEPELMEVEVIAPRDLGRSRPRNLSLSGILFESPEPLDVGEEIEIRLSGIPGAASGEQPLRVRGNVVRLEEIPERATAGDARPGEDGAVARFEIGVALEMDLEGSGQGLLDLLEKVQGMKAAGRP